jgi:hypothetical protein
MHEAGSPSPFFGVVGTRVPILCRPRRRTRSGGDGGRARRCAAREWRRSRDPLADARKRACARVDPGGLDEGPRGGERELDEVLARRDGRRHGQPQVVLDRVGLMAVGGRRMLVLVVVIVVVVPALAVAVAGGLVLVLREVQWQQDRLQQEAGRDQRPQEGSARSGRGSLGGGHDSFQD